MSSNYYVAFWNLENLFDIEDSPRRTEKLQRTIGKDIKGWTQQELDHKIKQLASIIIRMNTGKGPDLFGVCEIENAHVLQLLVQALAPLGRSYAVEHHDMSDQRGIDVGFIYDSTIFNAEQQFSHFVVRRTATRDLFQVNFRTKHDRLLVVIGNHWPSRGGGQLESAPYRAIAGETLAYFHERILEVTGQDTPVIAMGDFNDEPFDFSLFNHALSVRNRMKVLNSRVSRFLNLMWPVLGKGLGALYFDNFPFVFDQFMVNKNLLKQNAPINASIESVEILRFPEMIAPGDYPRPIRFGGMGKPIDLNGFSDHFPIAVSLTEAL